MIDRESRMLCLYVCVTVGMPSQWMSRLQKPHSLALKNENTVCCSQKHRKERIFDKKVRIEERIEEEDGKKVPTE